MPAAELEDAMREADVVVSHAGVGSALTALRCGKCPVLVPRSAALHEHVDDHQAQIAIELERRNLAVVNDADSLCLADLIRATSIHVTSSGVATPIVLDNGPSCARQRAG
jgi:UDP-N-acetylglucosamine transferase subunit ALG13